MNHTNLPNYNLKLFTKILVLQDNTLTYTITCPRPCAIKDHCYRRNEVLCFI